MDCVLLVGNREDYREVANENNKAFLKIGDQYILEIMLNELKAVAEITRISLVGPSQRLKTLIKEVYPNGYPKPISIFEQKADLLENALLPIGDQVAADPNCVFLFLPSDIPLVTAEEIREFVQKSDMGRFDFITGVVNKETLDHFAPKGNLPGMEMLCFSLAEGRFRINNMHLVRPSAITKINYIRELYGMRYQKKFINGLKMLVSLLFTSAGPTAFFYYLKMRISNSFRLLGWLKLAESVEKRILLATGEASISKILGARFRLLTTSFGGTTIDVDNEKDYETVCLRFEEWRTELKKKTAQLR